MLTLVSVFAGFGKKTFLREWVFDSEIAISVTCP
jgi:hypothetical protein